MSCMVSLMSPLYWTSTDLPSEALCNTVWPSLYKWSPLTSPVLRYLPYIFLHSYRWAHTIEQLKLLPISLNHFTTCSNRRSSQASISNTSLKCTLPYLTDHGQLTFLPSSQNQLQHLMTSLLDDIIITWHQYQMTSQSNYIIMTS